MVGCRALRGVSVGMNKLLCDGHWIHRNYLHVRRAICTSEMISLFEKSYDSSHSIHLSISPHEPRFMYPSSLRHLP
jgi:hypothetical protein